MLTSLECSAMADEMDLKVLQCPAGLVREAYDGMAKGWRDTAELAARQERGWDPDASAAA